VELPALFCHHWLFILSKKLKRKNTNEATIIPTTSKVFSHRFAFLSTSITHKLTETQRTTAIKTSSAVVTIVSEGGFTAPFLPCDTTE